MQKDNISTDFQGVCTKTDQTNRPTDHEAEPEAKGPKPCGLGGTIGGGSSVLQTEPPSPAARPRKLNWTHLTNLRNRLSERDIHILRSIEKHRFLLTGQVERLYFTDGSSPPANTRATNRALKKLNEYGLINPLKRRIGGVRAGSASLIWHLTEPGYKLLHLDDSEAGRRKRFDEPSPMFLEHTLAVAECAVQLFSICRPSEDLELISVDSEPSCWRPFTDNGRTVQLKPDLFAITTYEDYEDQWFIEVDLNTESVSQVVEKCKVYRKYFYTGLEQKKSQLFPVVVWLVPDEKRKNSIKAAIKESIPKEPKMFLVITPDELEKMLRQYIESDELC